MQIDLEQYIISQAGEFTLMPAQSKFDPEQITTDSRNLARGSIFVPLQGENFDGHAFIGQAMQAGAIWAMANRDYYTKHREDLAGYPLFLVQDTLQAYQALARYWRRLLNPQVIAITGSSGKTSTKEILAQLLAPYFCVHKTELNYNNEIGVPKTLLQVKPEHEVIILEMGMRGLGQIRTLAEIAEPNYGIISNIGTAHLSELGSIEKIAEAKWELADYLASHQGVLAITDQDIWLERMAEKKPTLKIAWTGKTAKAQIQLQSTQTTAEGQTMTICSAGKTAQIALNLPGEHQALNTLNCLAILKALGQEIPSVCQIEVPEIFGRYQVLHMPENKRIINDAYNANPDSMRASLQVLNQIETPQRVAVLGMMGELGPDAAHFHQALGDFCLTLNLDLLCVIGEGAWGIVEAAGGQRFPVRFFETNQAAAEQIPLLLEPGAVVLFKASRSAKLEEVINAFLNPV